MGFELPPPHLRDGEYFLFANAVKFVLVDWPECVVTSWWRGPNANVQAGGTLGSLHLEGKALDVDLPLADSARLAAFGRAFSGAGVSALVYDTPSKSYVHVQSRPLISGATFAVQTSD